MKAFAIHMALVVSVFFALNAEAQYLANPSFEGVPASGVSPPNWVNCNAYSTPDTQPGFYEVNTPASDGQTYVSLVTRGTNGQTSDHYTEAIQAHLLQPLTFDNCYSISIDVARSLTMVSGYDSRPFNAAVVLKIWLGDTLCNRIELIAESNPVANSSWETLTFNLSAENTGSYIMFEATYPGAQKNNGNILIDNVIISLSIPDTVVVLDTIITSESEINLDASYNAGSSFEWTYNNHLSCLDCPSPLVTVNENSEFAVLISDLNNCKSVEIFRFSRVFTINIADVFTPNGDGVNDVFFVDELPPGSSFQVLIVGVF